MKKESSVQTGIINLRVIAAVALCSLGASLGWLSFASTPSSGTLTDTSPPLNYTAGPFNVPNQSPVGAGQLDVGPRCNDANAFQCDSFALTVSLPAGYAAAHPNAGIKLTLFFTETNSNVKSDYDLYIFNGVVADSAVDGTLIADHQAATGANPEVAVINPVLDGSTQYTVKIVPFQPAQEIVHVRIELLPGSGGLSAGFGGADPTTPGVPRYQIFAAPAGSSAQSAQGEFNIGFDPKTKRIMAMNTGPIWRLTPGEVQSPPKPECCEALWEDKSAATTNTGLDPILWTDQKSGRTFASNSTAGANAVYAFTDAAVPFNDGDNWVPFSPSPPNFSDDHETIGSGPYPLVAGMPNPLATAANQGEAVYYCGQTFPVGSAECQRSDNLGVSYGSGVPVYNGTTSMCNGLHGHVHVAPDGTAWLPVPHCTGVQGGAFSTDSGVTWTEFTVPGAISQINGADPSIAIDADSTIYYSYVNNEPVATSNPPEGHARVVVGHRVGTTINWTNNFDLGASHGIINAAEIEAVGGSSGRAAVGFLGTNVNGDYQAVSFPGTWYAFIATTYDGGATWTTVNATPNDPVQSMSGVWQGGGSRQDRNLLDFNEITVDDKGHVLYGYSDGCVTTACIAGAAANDFVGYMRVARQSGGKSIFASYDVNVNEPAAPKPPCLSGTRDSAASHLTWNAPDNGGSDITGYVILRGTTAGSETVIVPNTGNAKTTYNDTTADPSVPHYFYVIKAINAPGTGLQSNEIDLVVGVTPTPCVLPGILVDNDLNADGTDSDAAPNIPPDPRVNIRQMFIAEPVFGAGVNKLVFTMQMAPSPTLTSPPASSQWYIIWNRKTIAADGSDRRYVAMKSDATGALSFDYGNFGPPLPIGGVPPPNANTPTSLGSADSGTYNVATGVATIYLSNSKVDDTAPVAGDSLSGVNVRTYLARPDAGQKSQNNANDITGDGNYTLVGNGFCGLQSVVSRMTHGTVTPPFDINLPLTGRRGVECRKSALLGTGSYRLVFTFGNNVQGVANAQVTAHDPVSGTGTVVGLPSVSGNQVTVNLTNVSTGQYLTVTLNGVNLDVAGNVGAVIGPQMGVLVGDVNADGGASNLDVSLVKAKVAAGASVDSSNFRDDVNADGGFSNLDVSVTKAQVAAGAALPSPP